MVLHSHLPVSYTHLVAIGASVGGARAFCAMKHVGLNVAADPLFTVAYTGVNGGLVIGVADDPSMHSSQNEQDSRNYAKASKVPMIEPSDSSECKEFIKAAYEMSENFDTPVIYRLSTRVSHSQSIVEPVSYTHLSNALEMMVLLNMHTFLLLPVKRKEKISRVKKVF